MVDILADRLELDPAQLRLKNFIRPEQFPYPNKTGWEYDSGDYETAMRLAMKMAGYDELRREQAEKRARGELMGIGISFFTETVGAGPRKHMDIAGLGMADGAEIRMHPDRQGGGAPLGADPGPGPRDDLRPDRGRRARHPARRHRRRARRHRPDAVRPRHLRQPVDVGVRWRRRSRGAQGAREGEAGRGRDARGRGRRPGMGEGPVLRQGGGERGAHHPGGRAGRSRHDGAAAGNRRQPRRRGHLQPAQPDLPVRCLHLRRRHRSGGRVRSRSGGSSPSTTAAPGSIR